MKINWKVGSFILTVIFSLLLLLATYIWVQLFETYGPIVGQITFGSFAFVCIWMVIYVIFAD